MKELVISIKWTKVVDAGRFRVTLWTEKFDGTLVLLTFTDDVIPSPISLGFLSHHVKPNERPLLRCYKCQWYGQVAAVCHNQHYCGKCGGNYEFSSCGATKLELVEEIMLLVIKRVSYRLFMFRKILEKEGILHANVMKIFSGVEVA